eukprot:EG_transcript_47338
MSPSKVLHTRQTAILENMDFGLGGKNIANKGLWNLLCWIAHETGFKKKVSTLNFANSTPRNSCSVVFGASSEKKPIYCGQGGAGQEGSEGVAAQLLESLDGVLIG